PTRLPAKRLNSPCFLRIPNNMITVAGALVADVVVGPIRAWPDPGKNGDIDYVDIVPGGSVANTGMALARLGIPVSACAAVGGDNLGRIVKEFVGDWATRNAVKVIPSARTTAGPRGGFVTQRWSLP